MRRRILLVAVAVLALAGLLASCGSNGSQGTAPGSGTWGTAVWGSSTWGP
jgi:predicted small secreted protein